MQKNIFIQRWILFLCPNIISQKEAGTCVNGVASALVDVGLSIC